MTDEEAKKLLQLLDNYMIEFGEAPSTEYTVADLVDDLTMSLDVTDDESDRIRRVWGN
jgi:hypothetical protein